MSTHTTNTYIKTDNNFQSLMNSTKLVWRVWSN